MRTREPENGTVKTVPYEGRLGTEKTQFSNAVAEECGAFHGRRGHRTLQRLFALRCACAHICDVLDGLEVTLRGTGSSVVILSAAKNLMHDEDIAPYSASSHFAAPAPISVTFWTALR